MYFQNREEAGFTRAQASEEMDYITESRIEKIENGVTQAQPSDVVAMARVYKKPELCNYYCVNECEIGQKMVPEIRISSLSEIVLGLLSSMNALDAHKNRLIDITMDGKIDPSELHDFAKIKLGLDRLAITIEGLRLWCDKMVAEGHIDENEYESLCKSLEIKK